MSNNEITTARKLVTSLVTELGQITGALDTLEEINRLPTTKQKDQTARHEAATDAADSAFQLQFTVNEQLFPLLAKHTKHEHA